MNRRGRTAGVRWLAGETIVGRLLRWFLVLTVTPVVVVLLVTWFMSTGSIRGMRLETLAAIAEQKADRLHSYARERVECVTALGVSPGVNGAVRRLREGGRPEEIARDSAFLAALASAYRSPNVILIGPDLKVLHSSDLPALAGRPLTSDRVQLQALATTVERVRMLMQAEVSEPVQPESGERPSIYAVGPVIEERSLAGFLAIELDPAEIDAVVLDETGLGETGETVCTAIVGQELVLTAPTRHDANAAFAVRAALGSPHLQQLQAAARGVDFTGEGVDAQGRAVLGSWTYVASLRWALGVTMTVDEAMALATRQRLATMTIAALGAIPAGIVAWMVARSISRPMVRAVLASERMAQGDLSAPIHPMGVGEPLRLLHSMRTAATGLASLLRRLGESSRELEQTAAEIRRTARDQEDVAQGFGASATEVAAAVTEMTGTGRELAGTMSVVADAAENAAAAAGRGRERLADLDQRAQLLRSATDGVARRFGTIRERAAAINTVITTITRVADQTNLLSINAALEAEKAGRYGLGFQVVAREINRLSEQTAEATTDIERIVVEMQESVVEGVEEMGRFSRVMEEGAASSEQIASRLTEVVSLVEDLKVRFRIVAEGVEAQSIGTKQISEAMTQLSDGARRTIAAVQAFVAASEQLERSAKSLEGDVSRFKLPEA